MNKKLFLPSIGLMALLAACSNDELFENKSISVDNNGRPQVNVILGVENPGLDVAETRMAGDAGLDSDGKAKFSWLWRPNDVLGGALFSDVKGEIFNERFLANYNFVRSDRGESEEIKGEASFKSYSSVTEGAYLFYHPYISDGSRSVIGHKLGDGKDPLRVTDMRTGDDGFDNLADVQGDGTSKNFFFSSLNEVSIPFDMAEGVAKATELPLKFASAYSFFRIELGTNLVPTQTTDYYENFSISKIEVSSLNEDTPFRTAFTIDPTVIAAIQKDIFWGEGAVESNGALKMVDKTILAERVGKVREALRQEKYTFNNTIDSDHAAGTSVDVMSYTKDAKTNKLIYVLSKPYEINSKDDKFVLWIPVPAGTYKPAEDKWTFNGVERKATGALKIEVYTSEGKATFHLNSKQTTDGSITLARDNANKFTQTLVIDGDKTNIDLYSFNQGFEVATNEEYNFAINYIKEHSKEFSNRTPLINLSGDIEIKEMFDQALQIKTANGSTITLKNEKGQEFTLDPEKTILGEDGKEVPTLKVAEGNTLNFAKDIKFLQLINNGTVNANQNVTMQSMTSGNEAVLKIEDGKIVKVNAEDKVNANDVNVGLGAALTIDATEVAVDGDMDIQGKANVTLNGTTSNTTNNVTLCPTAKLTVTNGAYTSKGAMTINAEKDNIATVDIQSANATNEGNVTVGGMLKAKAFTNATGAILTAKAPTTGEGRGKSGYVSVATLTNNGTVVTEKSEMIKNTFGGTIDVNTLNNNAGGEINTNGELVVAKSGVNNGTINLEGDEYALIKLPGASYTNNGRIVIEEPEHYCMYSYYKDWNKLESLKGNGTIETTIKNQDQYNAVLAQQAKYKTDSDKYTVWDVINKVYVNCKLNLTKVDSKDLSVLKDIVLQSTEDLTVAKNLRVNKLIAQANGTKITAAASVVFNAQKVIVEKDAVLTNDTNVKLFIEPSLSYAEANTNADNAMLSISGMLKNYGELHTTVEEDKVLKATVAAGATLSNYGKIGSPAKANTLWPQATLQNIDKINTEYYKFKYVYRVRSANNKDLTSATDLAANKRTWSIFYLWYTTTSFTDKDVFYDGKSTYYKVSKEAGSIETQQKTLTSEQIKMLESTISATQAKFKYLSEDGTANDLIINITKNVQPTKWSGEKLIQKFGHIQDFIFILKNDGTVELDTNAKTYGFIKDNSTGTLKGKFTEDYSAVTFK